MRRADPGPPLIADEAGSRFLALATLVPAPARVAVAHWVWLYNFHRVHETLRRTPAMALGVTNHIWRIADLLTEALATPGTRG